MTVAGEVQQRRIVRPLIVGSFGQVGTALRQRLGGGAIAARGNSAGAGPRLDLESLAVDDRGARELFGTLAPDAVFCVGGMTHVDACEDDAERAHRINADGPARLARIAMEHGAPFVFVSTDYVFSGAAGPYAEDDAPQPLNVYGASKLRGEQAVAAAGNALIVRTTGVYGPDPGEKNFAAAIRRSLASGAPIVVPSDQLANPTYNADLADALVRLVEAGASGTVHAAGPDFISRVEFAQIVARTFGYDPGRIGATTTAALRQRAPRPLLGGLRSERLERLTGVRMRAPAAALAAWRDGEA